MLLGDLGGQDLVGAAVTGSAASWYHDEESGESNLLHVWLLLDGRPTAFSTRGGVAVRRLPVDHPVTMPELGGRLAVTASAGAPWDALVGRRIDRVRLLRPAPEVGDDGWSLHAGDVGLAVMDVLDELVARPWPSADWSDLGWSELAIVHEWAWSPDGVSG